MFTINHHILILKRYSSWRIRLGSNQRPSASETDALPTELRIQEAQKDTVKKVNWQKKNPNQSK